MACLHVRISFCEKEMHTRSVDDAYKAFLVVCLELLSQQEIESMFGPLDVARASQEYSSRKNSFAADRVNPDFDDSDQHLHRLETIHFHPFPFYGKRMKSRRRTSSTELLSLPILLIHIYWISSGLAIDNISTLRPYSYSVVLWSARKFSVSQKR